MKFKKDKSDVREQIKITADLRKYFHSALWEEEKHYTWFLSVILGAIVLVVVRMPPTNQLLYILVIFVLSYLGGFLSQVAFNVISYECEYFQIAFRRHIKAENRLFADPEPLPPRNWQAPTMWSLLVKFFKGQPLGIRGNFLVTFSAFDKVFLLSGGISVVSACTFFM